MEVGKKNGHVIAHMISVTHVGTRVVHGVTLVTAGTPVTTVIECARMSVRSGGPARDPRCSRGNHTPPRDPENVVHTAAKEEAALEKSRC